jgi:hypothetical protein
MSHRNVKSAFSFTGQQQEESSGYTPDITWEVMGLQELISNKKFKTNERYQTSSPNSLLFLELRSTHHLCNSSANLETL